MTLRYCRTIYLGGLLAGNLPELGQFLSVVGATYGIAVTVSVLIYLGIKATEKIR